MLAPVYTNGLYTLSRKRWRYSIKIVELSYPLPWDVVCLLAINTGDDALIDEKLDDMMKRKTQVSRTSSTATMI